MSFINECFTIIRSSNKDVFNIKLDNTSIVFDYYKDNNFINSNTLNIKSKVNFSNCSFNLDSNDNVYGVYRDKALKLVEVNKHNNKISSKDILTYNHKKFNILFPYINIVDSNIHLLYYVYNNNSTNTCALFHHYNHNGVWIENKIDFINHICLDNFVVLWSQNCPIVFYLKLFDGYEEVFFSRFNNSTFTWSNPVQITNSKKSKLYLSVLKDSMNFYHITFCENENNGYYIRYMNGYLNENKFDINTYSSIADNSAYMYPSLLKNNNSLYLMWVNHNRLFSSISNDLGKTWSDNNIDEFSIKEDFTRAKFISNYKDDLIYNSTGVFTTYKDIGLLGF